MTRELWIGKPIVFQIQLFKRTSDVNLLGVDKYVNSGASVEASVTDSSGDSVLSGVALTYITASNGIWRGEAKPQTDLTEKERYTIKIVATYDGETHSFSTTQVAKYDPGNDSP